VQPVRRGRLRGGEPADQGHHGEGPARDRRRAETTGQDQVHHEDPGDELAGRRDTDADPFPADPVGQRQIGHDQQHEQGVDLPEAEVLADRLEPHREAGDGERDPDAARGPVMTHEPAGDPDRRHDRGDADRRQDVQCQGHVEPGQGREQWQRDRRVGVGQVEGEAEVVHLEAVEKRLRALAVDAQVEPAGGVVALVLHVEGKRREKRAEPRQEEPGGHDCGDTCPTGGWGHGRMLGPGCLIR
jgi:hypothetical protein